MEDAVNNNEYLDNFIAEQERNPLAKALLHRYREICRDSATSEGDYSSELRRKFEEFIVGEE